MAQFEQFKADDIMTYLKEKLIGQPTGTFWHYKIADLLRKLLPDVDQSKLVVRQTKGSATNATALYNDVPLFSIVIARRRKEVYGTWSDAVEFFFKDIVIYGMGDFTFKEVVDGAIRAKARAEDAHEKKLVIAKRLYTLIQKELDTDDNAKVDDMIRFMHDNLYYLR